MERGFHLTLDAIHCRNTQALKDLSLIYDLLDTFPEKIQMLAITPPILRKWSAPPDPEWGLSGMIMISTSHLAIHTFPMKGKFYFDIFSCKEFDREKVVRFLVEIFQIEDYRVQGLER